VGPKRHFRIELTTQRQESLTEDEFNDVVTPPAVPTRGAAEPVGTPDTEE
jgi:hypothetical protein